MAQPLVTPQSLPPTGNSEPPLQSRRVPRSAMVEELENAEYEPLLPVERHLIGYSLAIGILMLGLWVWFSRTAVAPAPQPAVPALLAK